MQARDIMSAPVISVGPQTPVVQVAALLRQQRIGGVPVLQDNALVGMVTEKDLLHRHEIGTTRGGDARAWWRRVITQSLEPDWYIKSHGRCAHHVMSHPVVVVAPTTSLRQIAGTFDVHRIGRVPVVSGDRLVGIVTCADLVQALAGRSEEASAPDARLDDDAIRRRLLMELRAQPWWDGGMSAVQVKDGVVVFEGFVEGEIQRQASHVAAENIAGVRSVSDARRLASELPSML